MTTSSASRVLAPALALLATASATAEDSLPPIDMARGHDDLRVSGAVDADLRGRPADAEDAFVSNAELMDGEPGERLVYTHSERPYRASNDAGGTVILIGVGPVHASAAGEPVGLHVALYLKEGVAPGEYALEKGYIEVGQGSVPVAPVARTVSASGDGLRLYSHEVTGRIRLDTVNREYATGRFRFSAIGVRDEEARVTVAGAFNRVLYTPGPVLRVAGHGALAPGNEYTRGKQLEDIEATRTADVVRLATEWEFRDQPALVFALDPDLETGSYEIGGGSGVEASFGDRPASGTVKLTRAGPAYGAEFDVELEIDGEAARLVGHFDHVRPLESTSKAEYGD